MADINSYMETNQIKKKSSRGYFFLIPTLLAGTFLLGTQYFPLKAGQRFFNLTHTDPPEFLTRVQEFKEDYQKVLRNYSLEISTGKFDSPLKSVREILADLAGQATPYLSPEAQTENFLADQEKELASFHRSLPPADFQNLISQNNLLLENHFDEEKKIEHGFRYCLANLDHLNTKGLEALQYETSSRLPSAQRLDSAVREISRSPSPHKLKAAQSITNHIHRSSPVEGIQLTQYSLHQLDEKERLAFLSGEFLTIPPEIRHQMLPDYCPSSSVNPSPEGSSSQAFSWKKWVLDRLSNRLSNNYEVEK